MSRYAHQGLDFAGVRAYGSFMRSLLIIFYFATQCPALYAAEPDEPAVITLAAQSAGQIERLLRKVSYSIPPKQMRMNSETMREEVLGTIVFDLSKSDPAVIPALRQRIEELTLSPGSSWGLDFTSATVQFRTHSPSFRPAKPSVLVYESAPRKWELLARHHTGKFLAIDGFVRLDAIGLRRNAVDGERIFGASRELVEHIGQRTRKWPLQSPFDDWYVRMRSHGVLSADDVAWIKSRPNSYHAVKRLRDGRIEIILRGQMATKTFREPCDLTLTD